ncbi:DUF7660 family protein [Paenibacillus caseinilyticus]|uniref:DUF7660 domain-containing protein n=1 Tax=Paenibacillus mucilaginosus K02 TaxID=997761 RepID=I0BH93_9BACL|nr:hypothetical protein B2K_13600 [Paenibacillus mucilaginosus K02]
MNFPGNGQQVQSKEDFVRFLSELRINLSEHPAEWENRSLESYLEAMEAWLADSSPILPSLPGERLPNCF